MSQHTAPLSELPALRRARFPGAAALNAALAAEFAALGDHPGIRRSHAFHGRFENTYVPAELLPSFAPLADWVVGQARAALGRDELRWGFWFNEMGPGHRTSLHAHEEDDELLSAVYYIQVPPQSGRLVLWQDDRDFRIEPEPGMLLMFPPQLPHEVEENRSDATRLSVAFNFGPPLDED